MKNLLVQYAVVWQVGGSDACGGKLLRYYFFEDGLQEACQPSPAQGERRKGVVCLAAPLAADEAKALGRADFYTRKHRPVCICTRRRDRSSRQLWSLRQCAGFFSHAWVRKTPSEMA